MPLFLLDDLLNTAQNSNIVEPHMLSIIFQNANLTVNGTKTRRFDANFPEVIFLEEVINFQQLKLVSIMTSSFEFKYTMV